MRVCKRGHDQTPENVYVIPGSGARLCRACRKIASDARASQAAPALPIRRLSELPPPRTCMFALTDVPPHSFCGAPGYPWCPEHRSRVYQPPKKVAEA